MREQGRCARSVQAGPSSRSDFLPHHPAPSSSLLPARGGFLLGCSKWLVPKRFTFYTLLCFLPLTPLGRAPLWGPPCALKLGGPIEPSPLGLSLSSHRSGPKQEPGREGRGAEGQGTGERGWGESALGQGQTPKWGLCGALIFLKLY